MVRVPDEERPLKKSAKAMDFVPMEVSMLDDPDFMRLQPLSQAAWYKLSLLAGRFFARGFFIKDGKVLDVKDLAFLLHEPEARFAKAVEELTSSGFAFENGKGLKLRGFEDKQKVVEKSREKWREWQEAYRSSHASVRPDTSSSHASVSDIQPESESELKQESDIEGSVDNVPSASQESVPATKPIERAGGKGLDLESAMLIAKLNRKQKDGARIAYQILGSSGLGKPKLVSISINMATRIVSGELKVTLLAALASVYSNPTARSKPLCAVHRILEGSVPPEYLDCNTWKVIPPTVLEAAGIPDIDAYIRHNLAKRFTGDSE
jgi:hypothetical protein